VSAQSNAAKRRSHYLTGSEENWLYSKKKTYGYRERDEVKRQTFVAHLSALPPSKIVYIDESGMDNRSGVWLWLE